MKTKTKAQIKHEFDKLHDAAREVIYAYRRRFERGKGMLVGPIDRQIETLETAGAPYLP